MCVLAAVLSIRDISTSNSAVSNWISSGILVAGIALMAFFAYLQWRTKRRAADKVRMSDLILLTDVQILAKSNSRLLDDAIALRSTQMVKERSPDN